MIGEAYFQLRAQFGTALFSLLRLAVEAGASDETLTALRSAQASLRESFLVLALGSAGSGKSTLLNTLFEREFAGTAEPAVTGQTLVFQHGAEAHDRELSATVLECRRPHIFLRDFTVIETPDLVSSGRALQEDLAPFLPRAEVIFFVVSVAGGATAGDWEYLRQLGRDALKRAVFVVWENDRGSSDEAANAVKKLRQAMLKNLSLACPIFAASEKDRTGWEKLTRWIESEVIFSAPRRARLAEIDRLAHEALREIAGKPHAAEQAWLRLDGQLRQWRESLAEREGQSQRQIAGVLWTLAQSFDLLRQRGESLLRSHLRFADLVRGRDAWCPEFAREIEQQARASLTAQVDDALSALGADLHHAAAEHRQAVHAALRENGLSDAPPLPRAELASMIQKLETPLEVERALAASVARAAAMLRLPMMAVVGAGAVTLGAWPVVGMVWESAVLAAGAGVFVLLLALLLQISIVAAFGRHFTANRAQVIAALEPPLRQASEQFYAALARPLDQRMAAHAAGRRRHEPLLTRIQQLEQTFGKIADEMRAERVPSAPATEVA